MSYKIVYQNGEYEMTGFETVAAAMNEISSWDNEQIAITNSRVDSDKIVNETTGATVCYAVDKLALLEHFDISAGDDFYIGIECIGTYSDAEILTLK